MIRDKNGELLFDYEIVGGITNEDFASSYRDLKNDCESLEKLYNIKDYIDCCARIEEMW